MTKIEVQLPQMGEGVIEAQVTRWLAEINTEIEVDDPIVEIATDKVDSEIPAPVSGVLEQILFQEGETAKVGDVIAIIKTDAKEGEEELISAPLNDAPTVQDEDLEEATIVSYTDDTDISPFIKHYASQRGIRTEELKNIRRTGTEGELTKEDVLNYLKHKGFSETPIVPSMPYDSVSKVVVKPAYQPKEGEEIIEIDRMRKAIAQHMVHSVQVAPHVTSTVEIDITHLVQWRSQHKNKFKEKYGVNLTYTPIITEQVVKALKEYPLINVSFIEEQLILKKYINIGVATALPNGNLIVPVVHHADMKQLSGLALDILDLTTRARKGELKPGETNGGTFTITNLGQFNNIMGTPIINQPESAILAVGAIKKKPWVVEEGGIQTIGIRDVVTLSLSYDHRIIDGALGGAFLNRIGELLELNTPVF